MRFIIHRQIIYEPLPLHTGKYQAFKILLVSAPPTSLSNSFFFFFCPKSCDRKKSRSFSHLNVFFVFFSLTLSFSLLKRKFRATENLWRNEVKISTMPWVFFDYDCKLSKKKNRKKERPDLFFPLLFKINFPALFSFPSFSLRFIAACLYVLHNKIKEK